MKFSAMPYQRPDLVSLDAEFDKLLTDLNSASSATEQLEAVQAIQVFFNHLQTLQTLVSTRHEIDTRDKFYDEEQSFFDEVSPRFVEMQNRYYKALLAASQRTALENHYGPHLFRLAELTLESFSPAIMDDLAEENRLTSRYLKLLAGAQIEFDGQTLNLSQLDSYAESVDREQRWAAVAAKFAFFAEHETELDEIFSELVTVRDRMAKKLGFENYIPLGYRCMNRTDYGAKEVASFRAQVLRDLVPLATSLRKRQAERLGLDQLYFYDEKLAFLSGNAKPQGNPEWILDRGKRMYKELSEESNEFFQVMVDQDLLDLVAKEGKAGGGFCTFIPDYKVPFIFSNFNGTAGDVEVLTHEAGHAFQTYRSRNMPAPEYYFPTMDACEIHSMSMEFLTWPWMQLFFEGETEKFMFNHLAEALLFIPYGVTVDHFQHWVYENPTASPAERKAEWRRLEKLYTPSRVYDKMDYLERGGFWMRQSHIFSSPFYYIDYTLAQTCALQFWDDARKDAKEAWERYLGLCDLGGSLPFTELVAAAGLRNPFEKGCLASVIPAARDFLDQIDDSKF